MGTGDIDRDEVGKWLRLHLTDQVGAKTFGKLVKHFGGVDQALGASAIQLSSVPGIGRKKAEKIAQGRDDVDIEAELDLAEKTGVRIVTMESEDYPRLLKEIDDPPPVLYVKGSFCDADSLCIAVVGSRNCSLYGQEQASRLSNLLAAAGFTIVSGLARGIDTAAHRGALSAEGQTIAVEGCGLNQVYPPENQELAEMIMQQGALMSELPLTFEPLATTFPMRNRIISGLSLATLVVEARPRSGALITARLAVEQNREVMAVPGRVDAPGSWGPHQLIKDGAKLVEKVEDVLDGLGQIGQLVQEPVMTAAGKAEERVESSLFSVDQLKLTVDEDKVMKCLDQEPVHIDQIIDQSGLSAAQVNATVTGLQLKGMIKGMPGGYFRSRVRGD